MSDKYVINNCPAILKMSKVCDDYRNTRDNPQLCKDCTNCVLKQIIELCKKAPILDADWVLNKLDIQEVE